MPARSDRWRALSAEFFQKERTSKKTRPGGNSTLCIANKATRCAATAQKLAVSALKPSSGQNSGSKDVQSNLCRLLALMEEVREQVLVTQNDYRDVVGVVDELSRKIANLTARVEALEKEPAAAKQVGFHQTNEAFSHFFDNGSRLTPEGTLLNGQLMEQMAADLCGTRNPVNPTSFAPSCWESEPILGFTSAKALSSAPLFDPPADTQLARRAMASEDEPGHDYVRKM